MRRQLEKLSWVLAGAAITLGVALTYGVATGQQGGGPGGGPGRGMVQGTIAQKDLQNNAVLVNTQEGQRWVQLAQGTFILKQVDAKVADLKAKDVITINGTPTAVDATTVQITDPPKEQAGAAAAPAAPGGPGGGVPFGVRPGAFAMITGTVEAVEPGEKTSKVTVVAGNDNVKVTITTNDKTAVTRRMQVEVKDVADGEQFFAMGMPDERQVVQARFAGLGDPQRLFGQMGGGGMFGGGMFGGGPGGRQGGRRGGRGGGGGAGGGGGGAPQQ